MLFLLTTLCFFLLYVLEDVLDEKMKHNYLGYTIILFLVFIVATNLGVGLHESFMGLY